jgi:hypothetical protein
VRPRIIKGAAPTTNGRGGRPAERRGRATVVIADSGADAEVLVFPPEEPVTKGAEFHYRGTTWVVTGSRRDSGVLVAEPTAH